MNEDEDTTCAACEASIMHVFTINSGWRWIAVYGQETVPVAQCPHVPGPYGIGNGPHQPKTSRAAKEIPFRTGDPT